MNHNPQEMYYPSHLSAGHAHHPPQTPTSNALSHFSPHQHSQHVQSGHPHYASSPGPYGQYSYSNGYTTQQSGNHQVSANMCQQGNVLPLPTSLNTGSSNVVSSQPYPSQPVGFDLTGQIAPPGMKPKVTATLWEDEGSLCFQVEAKGVCVARREDNHMINGTKLLNVAGMTRGRRDGILKSEKHRHVVKIGPMHLKGVWIPFDRALEMANKEKITDILYPLFVQDIAQLLYHPTNQSRANQVIAASERRKLDQEQIKNSLSHGMSSFHQHHPSMNTAMSNIQGDPSHSLTPHPNWGRPPLDRIQNFPTPPTSASSVMGSMSNPDSNFQWGSQCGIGHVLSGNSMQIENGISHSRSVPNTPASTPPGTSIHGLQYTQTGQSYDPPRHVYSAPPPPPPPITASSQQNIYPHSSHDQQVNNRYSTSSSHNTSNSNSNSNNTYLKNELVSSSSRALHTESESHETKNLSNTHNQSHQQSTNEEEKEQENELEYTHGSEISPSPNHPKASTPSGRATPRTTGPTQTFYSQPQNYTSSPRHPAPSSNLYNVISSERGSPNSNHTTETFSTPPDNVATANGYLNSPQNPHSSGKKRARVDDDIKSNSRAIANENEAMKRRKILIPSNILSHDSPGKICSTSPINQRRR
ncbi:Cell pattern formation-associated protein STUA [Erysiphe necator]|nr:Cell pattern formation-associated protein STUA [Erysiphe necator]